LLAIHTCLGDNSCFWLILPACTMCQRTTPSPVAQPTHDPVFSWLLIVHHGARRSTEAGNAAGAPMLPAAIESASCQSWSVPFDGTTLQMNCLARALVVLLAAACFVARFLTVAFLAPVFDAAFVAGFALVVLVVFFVAMGRLLCFSPH
jgi:hypothetical protein